MRPHLARQLVLAGAFVVTSCSYPHAGPSLPDGATSADMSSALPTQIQATQPTVPSASATYPTGHPSLRFPSSTAKQGTAHSSPPSSSAPATPTVAPAASAPATSNHEPETGSIDSGSDFDNLDVVDPSLKGQLGILRVGSEPTANDLLSVFAGLKNKTSHSLDIEVQTIYKDKAGDPLNEGSWIPMTLKPHEESEYRSASISSDAVDFLVRVRRASNGDDSGGQ